MVVKGTLSEKKTEYDCRQLVWQTCMHISFTKHKIGCANISVFIVKLANTPKSLYFTALHIVLFYIQKDVGTEGINSFKFALSNVTTNCYFFSEGY